MIGAGQGGLASSYFLKQRDVDHLVLDANPVAGGAWQHRWDSLTIADVLWVTRRLPQWRDCGTLGPEAGLQVVTEVEKRVVEGFPPKSVVAATGLMLRPQEAEADRLGAYDDPLPMFERLEEHGARWSDGTFEPADVILWAIGFRSAVDHLDPLGLRGPNGGIPLERVQGNVQGATTAVLDHRVHLVGYGPSASTIGASRAARRSALEVARQLSDIGSPQDERAS